MDGTADPAKTLFVFATPMEAACLLAGKKYREIRAAWGTVLCQSQDRLWDCLITGPGGFNTAAGLAVYLDGQPPERVLDAGIAGFFEDSGLGMGSVALAEREIYLHTGVGNDNPLPFDLIPKADATRRGIYPLDRRAVDSCRSALEGAGLLSAAPGPFLTVSAITDTREKAGALFARRPCLMESMEGAAAAHVCALYKVPMAEIRTGSNPVGERDKTQWNIREALDELGRAVRILLEKVL